MTALCRLPDDLKPRVVAKEKKKLLLRTESSIIF